MAETKKFYGDIMKKYKHSLANYPERYLGYVVSPHKICLQFEDVVVKTRVAYRDTSDLIKLPTTEVALPITPHGDAIHVLAVGTPIMEVLELQRSLIKAYAEYGSKHKEYFMRNHGLDFKEELIRIKEELDNILEGV